MNIYLFSIIICISNIFAGSVDTEFHDRKKSISTFSIAINQNSEEAIRLFAQLKIKADQGDTSTAKYVASLFSTGRWSKNGTSIVPQDFDQSYHYANKTFDLSKMNGDDIISYVQKYSSKLDYTDEVRLYWFACMDSPKACLLVSELLHDYASCTENDLCNAQALCQNVIGDKSCSKTEISRAKIILSNVCKKLKKLKKT